MQQSHGVFAIAKLLVYILIVDYTVRSHSPRLFVIMNLTATLAIIYTSLHNRWLSEYQLSLLLYTACYYIKQDRGRGERWGVVSRLCTLCVCSVWCWLPPFLSSPARHSSHWPTNSRECSERMASIWHLSTGWLKQSQLLPSAHTGQLTSCSDCPSTPVTLTAQWPTQRAWSTVLH